MIQFKKVILHNFGSYEHVELELQNRGFCLVSGQNNYVKDNALSNGSGKSFLWSAICFALTGETISGIKTNLKNINIDEPDCWVQIDFNHSKDAFSLIRSIAPKADLKITKNNADLSGKGIRESERKLQELLPDINKDLLSSIAILGQGLPNKFSSHSPSGRKELLEKLTKSDFMIEDLKTRILTRQQELAAKIREFEDGLLANKTKLSGYSDRLKQLNDILNNQQRPDFDTLMSEQLERIAELQKNIASSEQLIGELELKAETLNTKQIELSEEKAKVSAEELKAYTESHTMLSKEKMQLDLTISTLKKEINQMKAIVDICPTCGQHLPNVVKPDTEKQEQQLSETLEALSSVNEKIVNCNKQHQNYVLQIDNAFKNEIAETSNLLASTKREINEIKSKQYATNLTLLEAAKSTYSKLEYEKQNWEYQIKKQQDEIAELEAEAAKITNIVALMSLSKEDFDQRLAIVKKMDSLIRRDFRGYLLSNVISYIDAKAKDYCHIVFGTRELSLALEGNALSITYCGKAFDGLSGGEKQRVDLILQLAIRDLLSNYLGLSTNILVLDEVTDFLDKKSCQAVMKLLEKELKTVESVFIISHRASELEIPIDSEVRVIKNERGISELY